MKPAIPPKRPLWRRRIWLLTATVLALYNGTLAYMSYREYQDSIRDAMLRGENTARLLAQETRTTFEFVTASLEDLSLLLDWLPPIEQDDHANLVILDLMATKAKRLDAIRGYIITDRNGMMVMDELGRASSRLNLGDRDYVQAHRMAYTDGVFVGKPVLGRSSGQWSVGVSKRLADASGRFNGVIAAVVEPAAFADALSRADAGRNGALAMTTLDGTIIARSPRGDAPIGQPLATDAAFHHGHATASVTAGGRLLFAEPVPGFPLTVHVSLDREEILHEWLGRDGDLILGMVVPSIAALGLIALLMRQQRIQAESEARYRLLAENSTDTIIRSTTDGHRLYVSPSIRRLVGWEPDEFAVKQFHEIIHPDDLPVIREVLDNLHTGREITVQWRYRHRSGGYVWVEGRGRAVSATPGEPVQYVLGVRDISAQKAAEQALEAANAKLTLLAATDHLTGLANRRHFDSVYTTEWMRARREQQPLSVLMLDVDHFKAFNDTHGHQAGDDCLIAVGTTIQGTLKRASDVASRYGGEEFVVLLPGTDTEGAQQVAEQLRDDIERLRVVIPPDGVAHVTVSIGVATAIPQREHRPAALIAGADAALYEAKQKGRNRVIHHHMSLQTVCS